MYELFEHKRLALLRSRDGLKDWMPIEGERYEIIRAVRPRLAGCIVEYEGRIPPDFQHEKRRYRYVGRRHIEVIEYEEV